MAKIAAFPDWTRAAREMRELVPPVSYKEIAETVGLSYATVWNALNPEAARVHSKRHNDAMTGYRREWQKRNGGRHTEMRRQREAARPSLRAGNIVRKARQRGVGMTEGEVMLVLRDPCAYCGGAATGVDHIVPVAHGGEHGGDNLAACCGECNRQKNTTPLLRFLLDRAAATSG
jgi:5-methylcytosine-specific restriction endonuclease McrA